MKTLFLGMIAGLLIGANAQANSIVLDLSRSHTVEDLNKSGLTVSEIAGGLHGQSYSFQNQNIKILLPGGRKIEQSVTLGTINTKQDQLSQISMYGGIMPHDQTFQVAKIFHQSFGLQTSELDAWYKHNIGKVRNAEPYSVSANLKFYPRVGITIRSSMNGLYPWVIALSISWDWDKQRDWNEERVWREFPPPAITAISLNPPSGLKYERRDAYKETLKEQKEFEQEQVEQRQTSTPVISSNLTLSVTSPKSSPAVQMESLSPFPWSWIIVAILLLIVAGGVIIRFLRK